MNCQTCGAVIPNGAAHCPNCGAVVMTQQTPQYQQFYGTPQSPYPQPQYQQPYAGQQNVPQNVDMSDLNIVLKIVCLLFPIVGIILYFVWKTSAPNKAKSAIMFAGIGFLVNFILAIL